MTNEERERAKLLEAILRYDLIRSSQESKEVTVQKIKNLINYRPINITNDGLPETEEDFDEIFDRLENYDGTDFMMTDFELDELYSNMMIGNDINLEYEGRIVNDFEDLVDFEKYQRAVEVNSLLADVDNFEEVVEENEEYF